LQPADLGTGSQLSPFPLASPATVIGMISLFNSISGGYIYKGICNSMLLGLNAFYKYRQCFLSEPWYDDPQAVWICFGSPMYVNGSVIPDCWALSPFD
jgi:hypothetical protein